MKRGLWLIPALLLATVWWIAPGGPRNVAAAGATQMQTKSALTPGMVNFGPPPAFVPPGAQLAVLQGDPMGTTGDYTVRLKMPDGYRFPPHWHPKRENVTVISGTFRVGMGDRFDEAKLNAYPAGSFAIMERGVHHFGQASGETVVQIHGQSPLQITYVNPQDDPSRKQ